MSRQPGARRRRIAIDCTIGTQFNLEPLRAPAYETRSSAALAQLVRAPVCGAGGPWFEPKRLYHS